MSTDPTLAKLTKDVKLAERSFNNTLAKRKEIRGSFLSKVNNQKAPRRPVGSQAGYKIPTETASTPQKTSTKKEMRIYLCS